MSEVTLASSEELCRKSGFPVFKPVFFLFIYGGLFPWDTPQNWCFEAHITQDLCSVSGTETLPVWPYQQGPAFSLYCEPSRLRPVWACTQCLQGHGLPCLHAASRKMRHNCVTVLIAFRLQGGCITSSFSPAFQTGRKEDRAQQVCAS